MTSLYYSKFIFVQTSDLSVVMVFEFSLGKIWNAIACKKWWAIAFQYLGKCVRLIFTPDRDRLQVLAGGQQVVQPAGALALLVRKVTEASCPLPHTSGAKVLQSLCTLLARLLILNLFLQTNAVHWQESILHSGWQRAETSGTSFDSDRRLRSKEFAEFVHRLATWSVEY